MMKNSNYAEDQNEDLTKHDDQQDQEDVVETD